jgi:hypothetical protein
VVGFDSIIPPGREGKVTESVNMSNYRAGAYTKMATITSNAKNMPSMQISIHWIIKAYASISSPTVLLTKNKNGDFETEVVFSSEKATFKVTSAVFNSTDQSPDANAPAWQKQLPVTIAYAFEKDSLRQDGYRDFKYKLSAKFSGVEKKNGEFIFKTNHEDAPELKISGTIDPGK